MLSYSRNVTYDARHDVSYDVSVGRWPTEPLSSLVIVADL